jgi:hypothetical protein
MGNKKKQRKKSRKQQSRQQHELKRRQKKKAKSTQQSATKSKARAYDPLVDTNYMEAVSEEMRLQLAEIKATVGTKSPAPAQTRIASKPRKNSHQLNLAHAPVSAAQPIDPMNYPGPPPSHIAAFAELPVGLFNFDKLFHPSLYYSKRLQNFVSSLAEVMREIGYEGKPFDLEDVQNPRSRTFLRNLMTRKATGHEITPWQEKLLQQVNFEWTPNVRDALHPDGKRRKRRYLANNNREKITFFLPGESVESVIYLDLWEQKLKRFESARQTEPSVDSIVMRKYGLTNWVTETRRALDAGALPQHLVARLNAANFEFKAYKKRTPTTIAARFDNYCQQIAKAEIAFSSTHISHKMDRKLNQWINKQRWLYRNGYLRDEQIKALKKLGIL